MRLRPRPGGCATPTSCGTQPLPPALMLRYQTLGSQNDRGTAARGRSLAETQTARFLRCNIVPPKPFAYKRARRALTAFGIGTANTMADNKFTVSIHIPKTAGTTVAEVFSRVKQRRVIFDYEGYSNVFHPSKIVSDNAAFIKEYFRVLHGHFYVTKYQKLFEGSLFVASLRHPVERVISQFMHEFNEKSEDAMFHSAIKSGEMSVVEFAEQPGIGDAMHLHLEGKTLVDYDMLFISERLTDSLFVYSALIDHLTLEGTFGSPVVLPKFNEGVARANRIEFDQKTRAAIFDRTQPDNAVYAEALSLLERKLKQARLSTQ